MITFTWNRHTYWLRSDRWCDVATPYWGPDGGEIGFYAKLSQDGKRIILSDDGWADEGMWSDSGPYSTREVEACACLLHVAAVQSGDGVELQLQGSVSDARELFSRFGRCLHEIPRLLAERRRSANVCKTNAKTLKEEEN